MGQMFANDEIHHVPQYEISSKLDFNQNLFPDILIPHESISENNESFFDENSNGEEILKQKEKVIQNTAVKKVVKK